MSSLQLTPASSGNRLLALLEPASYAALEPHLQLVDLGVKQIVGERDKPIEAIYFPCTCVLSVLAYMRSGHAVEVGTVGNEGLYGLDVLAGGVTALETTLCQVPGQALRMPAPAFLDAIAGETPLRRIAQRYLLAYLSQVSQSVACNRLHTVEERFARWILMTHDRVRGDEFSLTQEFIAEMLGVHRPSVSLVAGAFQQAGLIRYVRGHMTILKREALEEVACECYGVVRDQTERTFGPVPKQTR